MSLEILLLEDDPSKKNRLLVFLNDRKELFARIDTALCTADALEMMRTRRYDLFIADIIVPKSLGGAKSEGNCIGLFEQMDDDPKAINRPRYALPLSSSDQLSVAAFDFFRGRPWGILPYSEARNESLEAIEKIAFYISTEKARSDSRCCDVFIITALIEPEFSAIEALNIEWGPLEPLDDSQLIRYGRVESEHRTLNVAAAFATRMGPVSAAILTTKALLMLNPSLVIMAGICAGRPGKVGIGDVVAADISWDWQSGKFIDKGGREAFEIAPHQLGVDAVSRNQLLLLQRDSVFWNSLAPLAVKAKADMPKLVVGPMATGSSVLSDERVSERIKENQHKNLTGLDMETYAVFAAAEVCNPKARVISLKAVCDKGDKRKNDKYQEYAAAISSAAVFHFLKNYSEPFFVN